jgi:DNA mismatch endonuclease (patch repair protein)
MRAVKGRDTSCELIVRRAAHSMGYRYRLHRKDLPGKPDLVFPGRRKVIFVHGCFWHQHDCPRGARSPKENQEYWLPKLRRNRERDVAHQARLRKLGWDVLVLWECEVKDRDALTTRIRVFLEA